MSWEEIIRSDLSILPNYQAPSQCNTECFGQDLLFFHPVFAQHAPELVIGEAEIVCGFTLVVIMQG